MHIDGFNLLPYLTGEADRSPRQGFVYFSDDGDVLAMRFDNWKIVFMEQRVQGTLQVWAEPFVATSRPEDLQPPNGPVRARRRDLEHLLRLVHRPRRTSCSRRRLWWPSSSQTFQEFPPRQKAASFTIDQAVEKLEAALTTGQ